MYQPGKSSDWGVIVLTKPFALSLASAVAVTGTALRLAKGVVFGARIVRHDARSQSLLADRALRLRELHAGFVMLPNAWDAASARAFEELGFPAIATTSSGMANALGYADRQQTPVEEMFAAVARITRSVGVPVTTDLEGGYGLSADHLVDGLLAAGGVGLNIEDSDHSSGATRLVDAADHARYVAAIKNAGRARGVDVFLNARLDVHLRRVGSPADRLDEALRRARLYLAAGADSIYPIFVNDDDTLAAFVELGAPVNVLYVPDGPSLDHLRAIGVRRVTFGGNIQEAATEAAVAYLSEAGALVKSLSSIAP